MLFPLVRASRFMARLVAARHRLALSFLGMISTNMGCKLFVPLQLEVAQHFVKGSAGGRPGGFEPPVTFGAAETLKTLLLNPYQLTAHGRLRRCVPTSVRVLPRNTEDS